MHFAIVHPPKFSKHSRHYYFLIFCHLCHLIIISSDFPFLVKGEEAEKGLAAQRGQFSICTKGIPHHRTLWPRRSQPATHGSKAPARVQSTLCVFRWWKGREGNNFLQCPTAFPLTPPA